ncbi:hypothetical protein FB446DRAFT_715360 [Lentinula raphanica]|nr:hypothetical protein FB446DRAFT_715360 [Lentinula raphanica]
MKILSTLLTSQLLFTLLRAAARPFSGVPTAHDLNLEGRGLPLNQMLGPPAKPEEPKSRVCYFYVPPSEIIHNPGRPDSPTVTLKSEQLPVNKGNAKLDCEWGPDSSPAKQENSWLCVLQSGNIESYKTGTKLVYSDQAPLEVLGTTRFYRQFQSIGQPTLEKKDLKFEARCHSPTLTKEMINKQQNSFPNIPWQDWNIEKWPMDENKKPIPVDQLKAQYEATAAFAASEDYGF